MAAPIRITMPPLDNGRRLPNPIRWICDKGHFHPSRKAAVKCNQKHKEKSGGEAQRS